MNRLLPTLALLALVTQPLEAQRRGEPAACSPASLDSLPARPDSTYRNCDVDAPARRRAAARPSFQFPSNLPCAIVEFDAVVGPDGKLIPATARVTMTNHAPFAAAVLQSLDRWRYTPAKKGDQAVAQAVHERYALGDGRAPVSTANETAQGRSAAGANARLPAGPSGRPSGAQCD